MVDIDDTEAPARDVKPVADDERGCCDATSVIVVAIVVIVIVVVVVGGGGGDSMFVGESALNDNDDVRKLKIPLERVDVVDVGSNVVGSIVDVVVGRSAPAVIKPPLLLLPSPPLDDNDNDTAFA